MQPVRLAGERGALLRRHHQVSQAQARKQHLAEGAGVQHAALLIEALECGQGLALIAVLTVVVILDNPATAPVGPVQQGQPARQ
ncbi:hypothetical protein D3C80_1946010 [compost metagenome]